MIRIFLLILFLTTNPPAQSQTGWYQQNSGTGSDLKSVFFADENTGYAAGTSGTIIKTSNGGNNWSGQQTGTNEDLYSIYFIGETGFAVGGNSSSLILKTTNGGINWVSESIAGASILRSVFMVTPELIYASGRWGTLLKTTNGGINWSLTATHTMHFYSIFFVNDSIGYTGGPNSMHAGGGTLKTTNGGTNWSFVSFAGQGNSINFINNEAGFVLSTLSIRKTTNGGVNWTWIDPPSGYSYESVFFSNLNTGYVTGNSSNSGRIFKTTNAGNNWLQQSIPSIGSLYSIAFVNPNTGYAVGNSGTILKTTNGGISSVISISNEVPDKLTLYQNYPNPFNPSTMIKFDIVKKSDVRLSIFDIAGKEVRTLINQSLNSGTYEYNFNSSNLPSGVYLYRLEADDAVETRRMIILK